MVLLYGRTGYAAAPLVCLLAWFGMHGLGAAARGAAPDPPAVEREFRAAWIATVANIDWPSRRGLSTGQQQRELVAILDRAVELRLNALILQIRPSADALYASQLEPWSEYLTGQMGQPPRPFYDPLEFAVEEAHRRGLQLHVWFNPYRVRHTTARSPASPDHASQTHPEIVRTYGNYLWFDPGEPAAVDQFLAVMLDVVERYDIDGVHIDDYFYPYPIQEDGQTVPFPDDESYARAVAAGETLDRDDWRRQNVDRLIERMYDEVKRAKPHVLVGISPFGIWRPGHPAGITGLDQYSTLYADARKWFREGWTDYYTPQLYWRIDSEGQSYPRLLEWWADQNVKDRHLWPGNFTSRVRRDPASPETRNVWAAEEIIRQIEITREQAGATGNVHFSVRALMENRDGLADKLREGVYAEPALVPESDWLEGPRPAEPEVAVRRTGRGLVVQMRLPAGQSPWVWVVRVRDDDQWQTEIVPGHADRHVVRLERGASPSEAAVSAVTRLGREGPLARAQIEGRD